MDRQQPTVESEPGSLRLGPRSVERPADVGRTLIGGIDDPDPAEVDRGGLLSPSGASWTIDWWVGADDRWYLPAREPSVRQRRIGPGPIIETSMRVPSGDVVATAYPVVIGSRRVTVVEITNASPVPVVLAVAIRPFGLDGDGVGSHRLELIGDGADAGPAITVDGRPAVLLPRTPNEIVAADGADVLERVEAGAPLHWDGPVDGPVATAACLYPLPHSTSLRFVVPSDLAATADGGPSGPLPTRLDALPPADTVAKGWGSIIERAGTFGFPDPGLTELVGAARARLVLAAVDLPDRVEAIDHEAAVVLEALAVGGHADECGPSLERLAEAFPTRLPAESPAASGPVAGAAMVRAIAAGADLVGPQMAETLLESAAQLTSLVERRGDEATVVVAKAALARLVARAGQSEAASHLRSTIGGGRVGPPITIDEVTALARGAAPSGAWPPDDDAGRAARLVLLARGLLLDGIGEGTGVGAGDGDRLDPSVGGDRGVIRLLPSMPSAWLGGEVEVHRAPVLGVRVSFAIRWHGYRPALLWEIHDGDADADGKASTEVRPLLRCPGLDPDWSSDQPSGEALLAGTSIELPAAPAPGDSFQ